MRKENCQNLNQKINSQSRPPPLSPQKRKGGEDDSSTPALTYLLRLAAGTRGAAVSGRAASSLRRLRRSCNSQCDHSHQQHYFNVFVDFAFRRGKSCRGKSCRWADEIIRGKILEGCRQFLDSEDVHLQKNISARVPKKGKRPLLRLQRSNRTRRRSPASAPQRKGDL